MTSPNNPTRGDCPSMETTFELTEQDYTEAVQLGAVAGYRQKIFFLISCLVLAVIGVMTSSTAIKFISFGGMIGGFIGYFISAHVIAPNQARNHYQRFEAISKPITLRFSDEGFYVKNERGENSLSWNNVLKWRQNDHSLLIYIAPKLFFILPKRLTKNGFPIGELQRLLADKVGDAT